MPNDSLQNETTHQGHASSLGGAARVGGELREVRERLGWQLTDVAETLRIRLPYLEAIELGDLAALPGPAYQTGFVRSYAQLLGLDSEEILRRFQAEGLSRAPKAQLTFPAPVPDRGVPSGAIALVGVAVVLIGYGLWYYFTSHERHLALTVPSVPAELAPLAAPPKPAVPTKPAAAPAAVSTMASPPASTAPASTPSAPPPAPPTPAPSTPAVAAPAMTPVTSTTPSAAPGPMPEVAPPAPAGAGTTNTAPAPAPDATVQGKAILATADSWIEVRDATGTILFSKVLHAGQSWPVPQEAGLTLTTGNAGGTEITQDGKPGAPLGATGVVLHHYSLTPSAAQGAAAASH
ncbi:MAG TPA: RodZ domain-containing protein [Acidocella sp.]|jgi:cytoskeleton protein RodZ|uniref:RodZ domain-containing protein n=1 Tax=Acidocella sp. TaxID=50710 RepID=UPI002B518FF3|nr:RodZ domain-containing protein [Acidocella sp.]HVE20733.1 RodZ domain-containing protein [Acidocella sp.]